MRLRVTASWLYPRNKLIAEVDLEYKKKLSVAANFWAPMFRQGAYDNMFASGYMVSADERRDIESERGRICENINYTWKSIQALVSMQREGSQGFIVMRSGDLPSQVVDAANNDLDVFFQMTRYNEKLTEVYELAVKSGLAFLVLTEKNKKRQVRVEPCNRILLDPIVAECDGSDAGYAIRRGYATTEELTVMFPHAADTIKRVKSKRELQDVVGISLWMDPVPEYLRADDNVLLVDQLYDSYLEKVILVDAGMGEPIEVPAKYLDMKNFGLPYEVGYNRFYKCTTFANGTKIHEADGIEDLPFVAVASNFNPWTAGSAARYQSMTRIVMGIQSLLTRRQTQLTEMLERSISNTLVIENGVLYDPSKIRAGAGQVVEAKPGADIQAGIRELSSSPGVAGQVAEMLAAHKDEMSTALGITPAMLGQSEGSRDTATFAIMKRKWSSGVTSGAVENLYKAGRTLALTALKLIFKDRHKVLPKNLIQLNLVPVQGTETARTERFLMSLELKEQGIPIPTRRILEDSPIPFTEEEIAKIEQSEEEGKQMNSQVTQLQSQKVQVDMQAVGSEAQHKTALAERAMAETQKAAAQTEEIYHNINREAQSGNSQK